MVRDPYRWPEDNNSEDTKDWVKEENNITNKYLKRIKFRNKIEKRISRIWNYTHMSTPWKDGSIYFFTKNDGLQNQRVYYMMKQSDSKPEIIVVPDKLSEDCAVSLSAFSVSNDGKYPGYDISRSRSDWSDFFARDIETKKELIDHLKWIKFSGIAWHKNGDIFAVANLRGSGEYGEAWHRAGTKMHKQNVFDDFIYAVKYLIDNKYTNPDKLVTEGRSNGGLLIGAVVNQRPDLFKVAFPGVGVMDMLRYHKFTIGRYRAADYGTSEEMFKYLIGYSPLHNIRSDVEYPAIMALTSDHDDRVVPAHTFKYIATLQHNYKGKAPVLARIETYAGHDAGKSTSKFMKEWADKYAFAFYQIAIKPIY